MAIPSSRELPAKYLVHGAKGLSISQLMTCTRNYWDSRLSSAYGCTIKTLSRPSNRSGHLIVFAKVESETEKGVIYNTWFNFGSNRVGKSAKVMAQCSCPDYMFRMEYANAAHLAARLFYGNGEPPDEKNPGMNPGLCKHLVCLAREIIKS